MLDSGHEMQSIVDNMGIDFVVYGGVYGWGDKHHERKIQDEP